MNSKTKRITAMGLAAAYGITLVSGLHMFTNKTAYADTNAATPSAASYYYDTLTYTDDNGNAKEFILAKKFYKAIDEMNKNGDFKDGKVEYSLSNILTSDEIKAWVIDGNVTIPKAFGAARDAYYLEHPELFYIDFYKMTISAGRTNGVYSAYIDSGREANLYYDNDFTSEAQVNSAIKDYNDRINELVRGANDYANAETYGTAKDVLKVRYVNAELATSITYDVDAYNDFIESGELTGSAHNSTAYGGLVLDKAVCAGYSRAFKAVMDKLGVPCLVVSGYSMGKDDQGVNNAGSVAHAWNYVYLENANASARANDSKWYAVDVTWNSTSSNTVKYLNMGSASFNKSHVTDGIISTSNYEFVYPELSYYDYGSDTNSNGLALSLSYEPYGDNRKDDYGNELVATYEYVSYNGKDVMRLMEEDGLHVIRRYGIYQNGTFKWQSWTDLYTLETVCAQYNTPSGMEHNGVTSKCANNTLGLYTQYAVTTVEPNSNIDPVIAPDSANAGNWYYVFDEEPEDFITIISEVLVNQAYGTYVPAPYITKATPNYRDNVVISDNMQDYSSSKVTMDEKYVLTYEVTYDEPLHILDTSKPIGIEFITEYANINEYAKLLPLDSGKYVELVNENTLRFKFMPSLMYEHNNIGYTFTFSNVGSNKVRTKADGTNYVSDKLPNPITYFFARTYTVCPKCLGGGRLYIDCCAQPTLLSNSDLSEVEFRDPDTGTLYSENARSQMMLVVNEVDNQTETAMLNGLDENPEINVSESDIIKSETYDINLQICGKYQTIPNGSYVKIALGFPEGYGPESEGVTFKLYHYKHDNKGNYIGVEEIPCVVTKFGIVATVTSFSPYMVAVVDEDKASPEKTIFASVDGKGGKLNNADGQIQKVVEGGSYTYKIKADDGYQVYKVTLNGADVTSDIVNDELTLSYDKLAASNEIEIQYIAKDAVGRFESNGIVDPVRIVVPVGGATIDGSIGARPDSSLVGLIVGIVIIAAVAIVSISAIAYVAVSKKKR